MFAGVARRSEGCCLLRSNVTDWTPEELWRAYVQLTEAKAALRVHKSDFQIRPVWHHREDRVLAHISVCFFFGLRVVADAVPSGRSRR